MKIRTGALAAAALAVLAGRTSMTPDTPQLDDGDTLVPTGKSFGLAGHPAAMRGETR